MIQLRRIPTLLTVSFALCASSVAANPYVQGFGQWMDTDFDNSIGVGARIGYSFDELNSIELGYTYTDLDSIDTTYTVDGSDIEVEGTAKLNFLLANSRFTYPLAERFRVFAGAGLGATIGNVEVTTEDGSGDGHNAMFTYQFFGGAEFFILPQFSVHAAYRFLSVDDFTYDDGNTSIKVDAGNGQTVELGLTFYF